MALTREARATMALQITEAMEKAYEQDGEELGDFADAQRYLRDEASDAELSEEYLKWC